DGPRRGLAVVEAAWRAERGRGGEGAERPPVREIVLEPEGAPDGVGRKPRRGQTSIVAADGVPPAAGVERADHGYRGEGDARGRRDEHPPHVRALQCRRDVAMS